MDDAPTPASKGLWSGLDACAFRRRASALAALPAMASEGMPVIAYESRVSMAPLVLKRGAAHGNRFGTFHHADMIGQPLGTKQRARGKAAQGWIVLLPFAPDLWTLSLTHRTQILYQADIAYILYQLDLKPGDVVFESGTGSGSLSTALATAIAPHGHVHSFEFNADRVAKARVDFNNNGLAELITVRERDVCGNGFPLVEGGANAVFLDLPAPWSVVESAHAALKHQGRVCSFSPCIEQVQRTCMKLDEQGFSEIVTVEVLLRTFEVQAHQQWPVARPAVLAPHHRQKRPLEHTAAGAATATAGKEEAGGEAAAKKSKNEQGEAVAAPAAATAEPAVAAPAAAAAASASTPVPAATATSCTPPAASPAAAVAAAAASAVKPAAAAVAAPPTSFSYVTTKPYQLMRGHTGYLTFAVCNKF